MHVKCAALIFLGVIAGCGGGAPVPDPARAARLSDDGATNDADVIAFINENDAVAHEVLVAAGNEGPEGAERVLNAREAELLRRYTAIKRLRRGQLSVNLPTKLAESVKKSTLDICGLELSHLTDDPVNARACKVICKRYSHIFRSDK